MQVVALRDCTPFVPIGIVELLRKSIELAAQAPDAGHRRAVEVTLVAAGDRPVLRAQGDIELRCASSLRDAGPADVVVVSALDPDVRERLAANRDVVDHVRRAFSRGADVASVCTGAFLLAEAGILDGRSATTHWAFQPLMAALHPRVRLAPQAILVDTGRVVTSGGATSFVNLALLLVERLLGEDVARAASRMFLVDVNKSPQGAYAMFATQKAHGDEAILRVQELVEREVAGDLTVERLAREAAMSTRTFIRRFRSTTGNAPREYVQRVRIEAARRQLEAGDERVSAIAARVGYGDAAAFRKMFARVTGLAPAEYRARYGPRSAPGWIDHVKKPRRAAGRRTSLRSSHTSPHAGRS